MTIGQPVIGRVLVCQQCRRSIDVLEAAQGARTDADHRHLDADDYRCGECMAGGNTLAVPETAEPIPYAGEVAG